jgi:hypothetical protein
MALSESKQARKRRNKRRRNAARAERSWAVNAHTQGVVQLPLSTADKQLLRSQRLFSNCVTRPAHKSKVRNIGVSSGEQHHRPLTPALSAGGCEAWYLPQADPKTRTTLRAQKADDGMWHRGLKSRREFTRFAVDVKAEESSAPTSGKDEFEFGGDVRKMIYVNNHETFDNQTR